MKLLRWRQESRKEPSLTDGKIKSLSQTLKHQRPDLLRSHISVIWGFFFICQDHFVLFRWVSQPQLLFCISYPSTLTLCLSVGVSIGILNTISLRRRHFTCRTIILLHLLNRALLHWTLLWFPLKYRSNEKSFMILQVSNSFFSFWFPHLLSDQVGDVGHCSCGCVSVGRTHSVSCVSINL